MDKPSRLNYYISSHPKASWQLLVIMLCAFWQSLLALMSLGLYYILVKILRMKWWWILSIGMVTASLYYYFLQYHFFSQFLIDHFHTNKMLWQSILSGSPGIIYSNEWGFILDFGLLIAGVLATLDLIPEICHADALRAVTTGQQFLSHEADPSKMNTILNQLSSDSFDGTFLGVSKYTTKPIVIFDKDINQVLLVLGTTGAGKTITLRQFYQRAIKANIPLVILDGKPSDKTIDWLQQHAKAAGKEFIGFNCGNFKHYNCLEKGSFTALKDKIICLKEEWSSDYYRSIAEDYLQTTFEVLLRSGAAFDLKKVTDCLEYSELVLIARSITDKELMNRVAKLKLYDMKDITGLQAHLNLLINSELGSFFLNNGTTFNLSDAIDSNALVYFALPALEFPSFASVLGKLVINDLKSIISSHTDKKVFTVFDEFSVFAGPQVLNLVNMGRDKGVHAIFGTQGLADLKRVDPVFVEQVLNCVNTLICHRVNDQVSAQAIADWVGTKNTFAVTAQLDITQNAGMGTVRSTKEYIIHPDSIKQELDTGEAFYITKVNGFRTDKIKVKLTQ